MCVYTRSALSLNECAHNAAHPTRREREREHAHAHKPSDRAVRARPEASDRGADANAEVVVVVLATSVNVKEQLRSERPSSPLVKQKRLGEAGGARAHVFGRLPGLSMSSKSRRPAALLLRSASPLWSIHTDGRENVALLR